MVTGVRQLTWSAAEILALATKAARGAGAPPAQAARFGQVAPLHLMAGRKTELLAEALDALPDGPVLSYPLAIDRALTALAQGHEAEIAGVPFDELLESYVDTVPFAAEVTHKTQGHVALQVDFTVPRAPAVLHRISGCDALIALMLGLAARTFVPESDQSRKSGAGAGLTDND